VARSTPVLLQFDPAMPKRVRSALVGGLSCAVRIGDTLWTACDETCHVERLQPLPGTTAYAQRWGRHTRFALADYLPLAIAPRRRDPLAVPEADLEGLAYRDGYLWVLGSHARARGEADRATTVENLRALATIERNGNRYLLARIPVIVDRAGIALARKTGKGRERRTAACVRNSAKGSRLTYLLARDAHFGPFVALPGKENGLDCEGLAVGAGGRVFVGLRGPVLDGWAGVIELRVATDPKDPTELSLQPIPGGGKHRYRKHFLDLDGRGVRDLLLDGADLLILAGPTMGNSGSFALLRWRGGARIGRSSLVRGDRLEKLLDLPDDGRNDHPEGIAAWPAIGRGRARLLVVYERTAKHRRRGPAAVLADLYVL
jgi:hypothetical protein